MYIDDILIFSRNEAEYKKYCLRVFEKLEAAGLKVDLNKYTFGAKEIKFLGFLLSKNSICIDLAKLVAIRD